jgi:hypothetical protein
MKIELPVTREPPPGTFMTHWVIYKHPKDHPDRYVLRATYITDAHNIMVDPMAWVHKDVEVLRRILPPGLVKIDRHPNDDPVILETWI